MNSKTAMIGIAAAAITAPIAWKMWGRYLAQRDREVRGSAKTFGKSPYADVIEETLHAHEGEDSPFVHAFEEAMETETRHEEQLAKDTGLRMAQ